jgi:hypothetical protein
LERTKNLPSEEPDDERVESQFVLFLLKANDAKKRAKTLRRRTMQKITP